MPEAAQTSINPPRAIPSHRWAKTRARHQAFVWRGGAWGFGGVWGFIVGADTISHSTRRNHRPTGFYSSRSRLRSKPPLRTPVGLGSEHVLKRAPYASSGANPHRGLSKKRVERTFSHQTLVVLVALFVDDDPRQRIHRHRIFWPEVYYRPDRFAGL